MDMLLSRVEGAFPGAAQAMHGGGRVNDEYGQLVEY